MSHLGEAGTEIRELESLALVSLSGAGWDSIPDLSDPPLGQQEAMAPEDSGLFSLQDRRRCVVQTAGFIKKMAL